MPTPKTKINLKENQIIFWLNAKNYPLEAIYATAYVFIDRCYVYLDGDPKKEIAVYLKGKEKLGSKKIEALKGEFFNELLNYLLRVEIGKRNKKIREFIVGTALVYGTESRFLAYNSDEKTAKDDEWRNDPLGIAVPWEEKYAPKND